jgi:hypothetical protein
VRDFDAEDVEAVEDERKEGDVAAVAVPAASEAPEEVAAARTTTAVAHVAARRRPCLTDDLLRWGLGVFMPQDFGRRTSGLVPRMRGFVPPTR